MKTHRLTKVIILVISGFLISVLCNLIVYGILDGKLDIYSWKLHNWIIALSPLGSFLLSGLVLLAEAKTVGYDNSSIKLLRERSPSGDVDLFYLYLYGSGIRSLLAIVFSSGLLVLYRRTGSEHLSLGTLSNFSIVVQIPFYFLFMSMIFYFHHRLMHTKWLWPIHKVHHSATEMTTITNFRNHPVDYMLATTAYWAVGWFLGVSWIVVLIYQVLNGVYQLIAHSQFSWCLRGTRWAWVQDWVLLSPEEHRIHHSSNPSHWNKNFGIVPAYERIFGTWLANNEKVGDLKFGVPDLTDQLDLKKLKSIFRIYFEFWQNIWKTTKGERNREA